MALAKSSTGDPLRTQAKEQELCSDDDDDDEKVTDAVSLCSESNVTMQQPQPQPQPTPPTSPPQQTQAAMREMLVSLHRATLSPEGRVRAAAIQSLTAIAEHFPLLVLQTWLDQFARTNCGSSPTEYSAPDRVNLLRSLEKVVDALVSGSRLDHDNLPLRSCVARIIAMASEEMTRQLDVTPDIQKPCSSILIRLGEVYVERVMECILLKFQPGFQPHFYVVMTIGSLAHSNALGAVPFLKAILGTMVANMRSIKKENLRLAVCVALSRFGEAILDYLANLDSAPDPTVTKEHFEQEMNVAHDILFSSWLGSAKDTKCRHAVLEALGIVSTFISEERLLRQAPPVISTLVAMYKRTPEPYHVTQSISQILHVVLVKDSTVLDGVMESLLTALFTQVCFNATNADYSKPLSMKNHHEVLRCYDALIRSHREKLVQGLLLRLGSVDENVRLGSLTVLKHLLNSSLSQLEDKMDDILASLHSKLSDSSNKVRKMLAQLMAQLGRLGYLEGSQGHDFLDFIIRLCALPGSLSATANANDEESENAALRAMSDNILQLLTKSGVANIESVLWPHLIEYLLAPDFTGAASSVVRSLAHLTAKKRESESPDLLVDFSNFQYVQGPYVLFARLIVLAAIPFPDGRGSHVLAFLQNFASNINRHLPQLWQQRIPLLQHYLESHLQGPIGTWNQEQWEQWLLALLEDTLTEIGLEEWNSALLGAFCQQVALYGDHVAEKCFLLRAVGIPLKKASSRQLVCDSLSSVFLSTNHFDELQQAACASAFGTCASRHLATVLEKMEQLVKANGSHKKMGASFFGLLRDVKAEESMLMARCTIVRCVGQAVAHAPVADLLAKADETAQKFIVPSLSGTSSALKLAGLKATCDLAKAVAPSKLAPAQLQLSHHGDLMHEAIECIKDDSWPLSDKLVALTTALELIQCPPLLSQMTRCVLLKACFSAVFPALLSQFSAKEESYSVICSREALLKRIVEKLLSLVKVLLKQEMEQSVVDEIFTLLEFWLKRDCSLAREISIAILTSMLKTYLENLHFKVGSPTAFSPGPYIIGSIVPCCFDTSRSVQNAALQSLQILIHILSAYEGHAEENIKAMLSKLRALSSMSPMQEDEVLSPVAVSRTLADVLRERIQHQQLLPLLHSLLEGLTDEVASSARGTSDIVCELITARGSELYAHAAELVGVMHAKLALIEFTEVRVRVLTCVRLLAAFNSRDVVSSMLARPLPIDATSKSLWQSMAEDAALAQSVCKQLIETIEQDPLYIDSEADRSSNSHVAKHLPVAAVAALGCMFELRELESTSAAQFASVFVPLLATLGSYMGVTAVQVVRLRPQPVASKPSLQPLDSAESKSETFGGPFNTVIATMKAFFSSRGYVSMIGALDTSNLTELANKVDEIAFAKIVARLADYLVRDSPQFLSRLVANLEPLLHGDPPGKRLATVAFFVHIVKAASSGLVDKKLVNVAMDNLLATLQARDETAPLKIICVDGLSAFKTEETSEKDYAPAILTAFMDIIGEDVKSELNHATLVGLAQVLSTFDEANVHKILSELAGKVRPYFDCGRHRDSAAAIAVFAALSRFAVEQGPTRDVYLDHCHCVMVSLILHANDEIHETKLASREALLRIVPLVLDAQSANAACLGQLAEPELRFNYDHFLSDLGKALSASKQTVDMLPAYIDGSLAYLRSASPHLRFTAVQFLSMLISYSDSVLSELDANAIMQAVVALFSDKSKIVQEVAASNVGGIFLKLNASAKLSKKETISIKTETKAASESAGMGTSESGQCSLNDSP